MPGTLGSQRLSRNIPGVATAWSTPRTASHICRLVVVEWMGVIMRGREEWKENEGGREEGGREGGPGMPNFPFEGVEAVGETDKASPCSLSSHG